MKENSKIGVVILAAGSSSRLGYPKQLVKFRKKTLLQHSIEVAESFNFAINILVLGANATEIEMKTECRNFQIVYNQEWEKGMGTSIGKGISEALKLENELDYILILLSDQPFVTAQKIEELVQVQLNGDKTGNIFRIFRRNWCAGYILPITFFRFKNAKRGPGSEKTAPY